MDEAQPVGRVPRLRQLAGSVRFRVTALATLIVIVVLVATAVVLVFLQTRTLTNGIDVGLAQRADDLESIVVAGDLPATLGLGADEAFVQVVIDGETVASSGNLDGAAIGVGTGGEEVVTMRLAAIDDEPFRLLQRRFSAPQGEVVLSIGASLDDVRDGTAALARSLAIAIPIVAALLAVAEWWLVGKALQPVEGIRAEVASITGSQLQRRVPEPGGHDEIARLATTMNDMLGRIQEASQRQQRFVADASHELRSPLTRIRSEIEVDLAHPETADLLSTHRSVVEEAAGLERLVDDLLYLARSDAGQVAGDGSAVDLVELMHDEQQRVGAAPVEFHLAPGGAVMVRGSHDQLGRVVRNLVDNALRHAAEHVEVHLDRESDHVTFTVADDGPGVPESARDRIFDRFVRLDEARSAAAGGTGLGLAIVKDIVQRHNGTVMVESAVPHGARFVVTLPAAR